MASLVTTTITVPRVVTKNQEEPELTVENIESPCGPSKFNKENNDSDEEEEEEEEQGDLDCPICFSLLCEPLTTACNHSFCRLCLVQSTRLAPDGRSCPLCRGNIGIQDPTNHASNKQLEADICKAFPEDVVAERRVACRAALDVIIQDASSKLPIFCMPSDLRVSDPVALHLFEPRYTLMARRVWLSGGTTPANDSSSMQRTFIFCPSQPRRCSRALLVRVDSCKFRPDGSANIVGRCVSAVQLGDCWQEDGGLWHARVDKLRPCRPQTESEAMALMHLQQQHDASRSNRVSAAGAAGTAAGAAAGPRGASGQRRNTTTRRKSQGCSIM